MKTLNGFTLGALPRYRRGVIIAVPSSACVLRAASPTGGAGGSDRCSTRPRGKRADFGLCLVCPDRARLPLPSLSLMSLLETGRRASGLCFPPLFFADS